MKNRQKTVASATLSELRDIQSARANSLQKKWRMRDVAKGNVHGNSTSEPRSRIDWRRRHALGLPAGSVRALLAVLIFITTWGLLVVRPDQEVPDYLRDLLFIILGHSSRLATGPGPAEEPGPPPLYLPRGSVRLFPQSRSLPPIAHLWARPLVLAKQIAGSDHPVVKFNKCQTRPRRPPFMPPSSCTGPLRAGSSSDSARWPLAAWALPICSPARAAAGQADPDTSVILFWMWGGPSQFETYDPKPDAPSEYRGPSAPIPSAVPGLDLCELFPLQARLGDKIALVRSLHHTMSAHNDGSIEVLTGKTPARPDPTSTALSDHPDFGMVTSRVRGVRTNGMPHYVGIPRQPFMTRPTYLGVAHSAFATGDPSAPGLPPAGPDARRRHRWPAPGGPKGPPRAV